MIDPNELLARILKDLAEIQAMEDSTGFASGEMYLKAVGVAADVRDMHEWLASGGVLPKAWQAPEGTGRHWAMMPNLEEGGDEEVLTRLLGR